MRLLSTSLGFVLLCSTTFGLPAGERVFLKSARINTDHTVTLPVREGRVGSRTVWFIVTEASTGDAAERYGVSRAQKLAHARGSAAVQRGSFDREGRLHFAATVDFRPRREVVPTPGVGFPPLVAEPGAVAEEGYSPLVLLPDGTVLNAPHVANDTGRADKVIALDLARRTLRYELTDGFARDERVLYISTDASDPVAAALENVTFARLLDAAPFAGGDGTDSARASLAAFVNGPTGPDNPERQGLNSALLGEGDPLNLLAWLPNQGRYSPLWDVHLTAFAPRERPRRFEDFFDVEDGAEEGRFTAPDGARWGPTGFIVNCPILAQLD
jgi:hypothetical protein